MSERPGENKTYRPDTLASNRFLTTYLPEEGRYYLFKELLKHGIFTEILAVVDSRYGPGFIDYKNGITGRGVPELEDIGPYLRGASEDILWVRGGFRSRHPFLKQLHDEKYWMLLYRANTPGSRVSFSDVVLDDLRDDYAIGETGRLFFPFKKPTNPDIFFPLTIEKRYDVCIGSSHISDRKAQWKGIKAAIEYQNLFGEKLRCVLPSSLLRGCRTDTIKPDIEKYGLCVNLPGHIPRPRLNGIYGMSRLLLHLCGGGQNDRSLLEPLRAGCPVLDVGSRNTAPWTRHPDSPIFHTDTVDDPVEYAKTIRSCLAQCDQKRRDATHEWYERHNGMDVVLTDMARLFRTMQQSPEADRTVLEREYGTA